MLTASVAGPACTAVRWRDAQGVEHQLGLLAYRIREFRHGQELRLVTAGVGLRLSGPDCGVDVGLGITDEYRPESATVSAGRTLGNQVYSFLEMRARDEEAPSSRWGFFYLRDPDGERTARVVARTLGVGAYYGEARRGVAFGYADVDIYVGAALQDDVAYVRRQDGSMVLWKVEPPSAPDPTNVPLEAKP